MFAHLETTKKTSYNKKDNLRRYTPRRGNYGKITTQGRGGRQDSPPPPLGPPNSWRVARGEVVAPEGARTGAGRVNERGEQRALLGLLVEVRRTHAGSRSERACVSSSCETAESSSAALA